MINKKDFWLYNKELLWKNYGVPFFPDKDMTPIEKLNTIARFSIIFSITIILIGGNQKWLALSFMMLLVTIILYYKLDEYIPTEGKKKCRKSSVKNPFMNFILGDLYNNTSALPACEDNEKVIQKNFRHNIYQDVTDLRDIQISDRQFYTLSSTKTINDQKGFAEWLYGDSGKCKSTGKDCLKLRDSRYHNSRYYR